MTTDERSYEETNLSPLLYTSSAPFAPPHNDIYHNHQQQGAQLPDSMGYSRASPAPVCQHGSECTQIQINALESSLREVTAARDSWRSVLAAQTERIDSLANRVKELEADYKVVEKWFEKLGDLAATLSAPRRVSENEAASVLDVES
jgi:septal ring factor EnvC (AmiA/AmiB activator)